MNWTSWMQAVMQKQSLCLIEEEQQLNNLFVDWTIETGMYAKILPLFMVCAYSVSIHIICRVVIHPVKHI